MGIWKIIWKKNKCGSYYKDGYDLASKIEKFFLDKEKFEQYSQNAKKII